MDKLLIFTRYFILLLLVFPAKSLLAQPMPEVIALRFFEAKPNVTTHALFYERWKRLSEFAKENSMGYNHTIGFGDRGIRKDKFMELWAFNFEVSRNFYFPEPNAEENPNYDRLFQYLEDFELKEEDYFNIPDSEFTDYKIIDYDQLGNPKLGKIIAIREIEVKSELNSAFESYALEIMKELQNNVDGVYLYIFKGDRGKRKGKYLHTWVFDSYETRNELFPTPGTPGKSSLSDEFQEISNEISLRLPMYLTDNENVYTDYVLLWQ